MVLISLSKSSVKVKGGLVHCFTDDGAQNMKTNIKHMTTEDPLCNQNGAGKRKQCKCFISRFKFPLLTSAVIAPVTWVEFFLSGSGHVDLSKFPSSRFRTSPKETEIQWRPGAPAVGRWVLVLVGSLHQIYSTITVQNLYFKSWALHCGSLSLALWDYPQKNDAPVACWYLPVCGVRE